MSRAVIGRCAVLFVALVLFSDGVLQIASPPPLVRALTEIGFPDGSGPKIAPIALACAILLLIPRTAPLGALLTTAFLGGAVCSHFRMGEIGSQPQLICAVLGLTVWSGLYLSEPAVRRLSPLSTGRADQAR